MARGGVLRGRDSCVARVGCGRGLRQRLGESCGVWARGKIEVGRVVWHVGARPETDVGRGVRRVCGVGGRGALCGAGERRTGTARALLTHPIGNV